MLNNFPLYGYIIFYLFISGRHLGHFHFLVILNNTAMNTSVHILVWTYVFSSLGYNIEVNLSHINSMFNLWRNSRTVFKAAAQFHIPTSRVCVRSPISRYAHLHLLLSVFLMIAILVSVKWYLITFLICLSLLANDVERLFICLNNQLTNEERA